MMAGLGATNSPLVHGAAWTGTGEIGWGRVLSGVSAECTIVTLGGNVVGVSLGTL